VDVRQADLEDVDELARLRATWRERPADARYLAGFREWFRQERAGRWWWIATDSQAAVGMVNLKLFDRMPTPDRPVTQWGYLANLFVVPGHRGRGVGASLVQAVIDRSRAEGLVRIVLSPSELSVPLYGRMGFRPAADLLLLPLDAAS
jgi:predicted N-acetyltransferase YhbS